MKMSECFRAAADLVGRCTYCCYAVDYAALRKNDWNVGQRCRKEIERRLEGNHTVTDWLRAQGIRVQYATFDQRQDYRRRWLLALADEFEAKGM